MSMHPNNGSKDLVRSMADLETLCALAKKYDLVSIELSNVSIVFKHEPPEKSKEHLGDYQCLEPENKCRR